MLQAHERLSCKGDYVPLKGRINPCTPYRMCRPACGCSCRHTRRDPSCPSHTLHGPHRARRRSCVPLLQLLSLHSKIHEHSVFHLLTRVSAMEICFCLLADLFFDCVKKQKNKNTQNETNRRKVIWTIGVAALRRELRSSIFIVFMILSPLV